MRPSFTQVRPILSLVSPSTRDGTFQDAQSLNDFSSLPPELRQIPAHTVFLCPSACSQHTVSYRRTSFTQVRPILSFLSPSTRDGTFQELHPETIPLPPELRQIPAHTVFPCPSACSQHSVIHGRLGFTQVRSILPFSSPSTRDCTSQEFQFLKLFLFLQC